MMDDFAKEPCGADGLSFPNGLPDDGQYVSVRTVWSNGNFIEMYFRENYSRSPDRAYDWFGVYGKPDIVEGSLPIILEWRETHKTPPTYKGLFDPDNRQALNQKDGE